MAMLCTWRMTEHQNGSFRKTKQGKDKGEDWIDQIEQDIENRGEQFIEIQDGEKMGR